MYYGIISKNFSIFRQNLKICYKTLQLLSKNFISCYSQMLSLGEQIFNSKESPKTLYNNSYEDFWDFVYIKQLHKIYSLQNDSSEYIQVLFLFITDIFLCS